MTEPNGEAASKLKAFHRDWRTALNRVALAEQSLDGSRADALAKEARFKGAAELVYGLDTAFAYDEKTDTLTFTPPNRATRRAIAKQRAKKGRKRAAAK